MTVGSPESLFFYIALLFISVFLWRVLLGLFKIKSLALACALGYMTVAVYAAIKGWKPLEPAGFDKNASEVVTLSWPAALLVPYINYKYTGIILAVAAFQYCAAGWVLEMFVGSIFGDKK